MNYEPYYSEGWKNNEEGGTPITAASLNHVDDGLLDHDEDLQNIFGDMATMEESETASQSYAVGDYLILDGLLYKVTTTISTGGSIAPGTNCEQTTVGDEIIHKMYWGYKSNVSFNDIVTPGEYYCDSCTDTPNNSYTWILEVVAGNRQGISAVKQIATRVTTNDRYERYKTSQSSWSAWVYSLAGVASQSISIGTIGSSLVVNTSTSITAVPSGRKAIGAAGYALSGTNFTGINVSTLYINDNKIYYTLRNTFTTDATSIVLRVDILYV